MKIILKCVQTVILTTISNLLYIIGPFYTDLVNLFLQLVYFLKPPICHLFIRHITL